MSDESPIESASPPTEPGADADDIAEVNDNDLDGGDVDEPDAVDAELADLVDIELLLRERQEYLDALLRVQAEFENYKKRMVRQQTEVVERAAGVLVEKLLPVLDTFDLAITHGEDALEPIYRSLIAILEGEGLVRIDPVGLPFDPNEHDAVAHEPGDVEHPEVLEVLRAGYRWKGRVLRPAMVKVKG